MRVLLKLHGSANGVWVAVPADADREAVLKLAAAKLSLESHQLEGNLYDEDGNVFDEPQLIGEGGTCVVRKTGGAKPSAFASASGAPGHGTLASRGGIYKFIEKDEYVFGDLTRAAFRKAFKKKKKKNKGGSKKAKKHGSKQRATGSGSASASASASATTSQVSSSGSEGEHQPATAAAARAAVTGRSASSDPSIDRTFEKAPGPPPRFLVGNIPDILPSLVPACRRLAVKYGPLVRLQLLGGRFFVISSPKLVGPLLALPDKCVPKQEIAGDGIFLADGDLWQVARSTLQLCFTDRFMPLFAPTFEKHTRKVLAFATTASADKSTIEVSKWAERLMWDVICEAGFKLESDAMSTGEQSDFNKTFAVAFNIQKKRATRLDFLNHLPTTTNRRFAAALQELNSTVDGFIADSVQSINAAAEETANSQVTAKKKKAAASGASAKAPAAGPGAAGCPISRDLLSLMLAARHPETGEALEHENLRHQLITLLVAGHKTASLLLSWTLYEITQHPEVEAAILKEQVALFGSDDQRAPTLDEIKQMRYLDQVCRETLRLYPPAQSVVRGTAPQGQGVILDDRFLIKPDSKCLINVMGVHRDPEFWPDPEKYDPSRFAPDKVKKMHPYQFIAFGGGPRMCLGNLFALTEVKMMLSLVVRQFSVRMAPGKPVVTKEGGNPLTPVSGIHTLWERRTNYAEIVQDASSTDLSDLLALDSSDSKPFAVLAASVMAPVTRMAAAPVATRETISRLTVLFGSNQGSCEEFAHRLMEDGEKLGVEVEVHDLDSFVPTLEKEFNLPRSQQDALPPRSIVFVCGSYNGLPPDNARKFCAWLEAAKRKSKGGELSHVEYAVFGCGNAQWAATFQKIPRQIDEALSGLGADRFMSITEADEDLPAGLQVSFTAFTTLLWPILGCSELPGEEEALKLSESVMLPKNATPLEVTFPSKFVVQVVRDAKVECEQVGFSGLVPFTLHESHELLKDPSRSTRHIEIVLPSGVTYAAGDHFEVLPRNSKEAVASFAEFFSLNVETKFILKLQDGQSKRALPELARSGKPLRLGDLLEISDLNAAPSQQALLRLAARAQDVRERETLLDYAQSFEDSVSLYEEYVLQPRRSLREVCTEHKSVILSLADVLEVLVPLKPRYYSISSSPVASKGLLTLTVGVANDRTPTGREHQGVCSNYLAQLKPGDQLLGRIRESNFRLPAEQTTPLVFCCNGTGLAPFMAFLRELKLRDPAHRPSSLLLFFGCRSASEDFLYEEELRALEKEGVVTQLYVAFSRDQKEKVYIQHLMEKERKRLWEVISKDKGVVMLCGDARTMARGVRDTVSSIVSSEGSMSQTDARQYVDSMESREKYIADVWGGN